MQAKRVLERRNINFLYSIKMSKKTLKCDNVKVNKKEFHASKQTIPLNLLNVNQILISVKLITVIKSLNIFPTTKVMI